MHALLDSLLTAFERGTITRRELATRLGAMVAALAGVARVTGKEDDATKPTLSSKGLNHLALRVTDVGRSRDWYAKHLGLSVLHDSAGSCFMRSADDFVALFRSSQAGLHHYCYTVGDTERKEAFKKLKAAGLEPWKEESRVYFKDPDGLTVQVADENDWGNW